MKLTAKKTVPKKTAAVEVAATKLPSKTPMPATSQLPDEVEKTPIKKKQFLERAVANSGVKKKDAKPAIEAALALISEYLIAGEELNLPPLGKLKVNRIKDLPNAKVLVVKLRIPNEMGVATPDTSDEIATPALHLDK
jgi:hypothetical protein